MLGNSLIFPAYVNQNLTSQCHRSLRGLEETRNRICSVYTPLADTDQDSRPVRPNLLATSHVSLFKCKLIKSK